MATIKPNCNIILNRGDSFEAPLFINAGTEDELIRFSLPNSPKAAVYLGVMPVGVPFEDAIIRKKYDWHSKDLTEFGDVIVGLKPADTLCLKPGTYDYVIKLRLHSNDVYTVLTHKTIEIIG